MKAFLKWLCLLLAVFFLSGCGKKAFTPSAVVTSVQITAGGTRRPLRRLYTEPDKIQMVLDYLRLQEGEGPADTDPERLTGTDFVIDVRLSDGSHSIYYQRGGRYLSGKYRPWQKIDEKKAADFYRMLRQTPTDT